MVNLQQKAFALKKAKYINIKFEYKVERKKVYSYIYRSIKIKGKYPNSITGVKFKVLKVIHLVVPKQELVVCGVIIGEDQSTEGNTNL